MTDRVLKKWQFYFFEDKSCEDNGFENRFKVIKAFADFWQNRDMVKLEIPGKCVLGGKFGDEITDTFTSYVKTIERVEKIDQNDVPHDLLCATTTSNQFYFYSDEHNIQMFLMLKDIIISGKLSPERYHYLRPEFEKTQLI